MCNGDERNKSSLAFYLSGSWTMLASKIDLRDSVIRENRWKIILVPSAIDSSLLNISDLLFPLTIYSVLQRTLKHKLDYEKRITMCIYDL